MFRRSVPWLLLVALAGCMEGTKPNPLKREPSLYSRLGGESAIKGVVDDFVANVVDDDKIREQHKKHFREGDVAGLKRKLVEQLGAATGGPQKYTGRTMKEAHKGLGINDADFDALVADLEKALDKNRVGPQEKDELKKLLASLRGDVIEPPAPRDIPEEARPPRPD